MVVKHDTIRSHTTQMELLRSTWVALVTFWGSGPNRHITFTKSKKKIKKKIGDDACVREYLPKGFNGSRNITHRVNRTMEEVVQDTARLVIRHQAEGGCRDTTNIPP